MNLSKGYLLVLVGLFAVLSLLLVLPFLQYVLAAVLLAYILFPLHRRLAPRTSPTISAFAMVVLAIAGFLIPFVVVIAVIAEDAVQLLQEFDADAIGLADIESQLEERTGLEVDLASTAADAGQEAGMFVLERTTEIVSTLTHVLIGLGLALFLIYYLLKDGRELMGWIRETTPLPSDVQDDLYGELDEVTRAVLLGHVLIAIIEGVIAGLGLFATGIPNAAFWTFIMIILSLVPLIGAFLVWGPAVVYLFVTGEPVLAVALFVYSAVVVGVADDYLRPIVVDRYAELSPAVIILGVLGGIYAFGIMGLFFGPVVLGAFKAVLSVVDDHYHRLEDGSDAAG
ncbi:AI-2E family transporter [Natrononativus amylolyticus]|uniref:AI-2E family transporter n=1 Tax=Natrononativus amylolyticus TaxID=2963434 RepID=UPI0020CEB492|nr:AI-2E family transporter [Natrononativus amylolyticus]